MKTYKCFLIYGYRFEPRKTSDGREEAVILDSSSHHSILVLKSENVDMEKVYSALKEEEQRYQQSACIPTVACMEYMDSTLKLMESDKKIFLYYF